MFDEDSLEELNLYLAESREHLATIESDLLAIEERGADIDEKLVNKVFRAAHSIKGGAGFFGLSKIQELGHKIENVLDMIRSREIAPNPEVVNILLISFDRLRDFINNPGDSNQADISDFIASLTGMTRAGLPENKKDTLTKKVNVPTPTGTSIIQVTEFDLSRAEIREEYVYLVEIDLIHDVQRRNKTPWEVFRDIGSAGTIIECAFNFDAVGTLDDDFSSNLPLEILFATIIDPSFIGLLFEGISKEHIRLVQEPKHKQPPLVPTLPAAAEPVSAPVIPEPKKEPEVGHLPVAPVVKEPELVP